MKWEIWYSKSNNSTSMFASGYKDQAGSMEADAKCIKKFEATNSEEAKKIYKGFLYGDNGYFNKLSNK